MPADALYGMLHEMLNEGNKSSGHESALKLSKIYLLIELHSSPVITNMVKPNSRL